MAPDVLDLAHDRRGTGPLLVLIHGITEDRRSWDPLTNDLAHDHTVLRVDLRGHGESPAGESYGLADYAADIKPLVGDKVPLLVGHSLGGTVATAYAAAFETRGVVNVDQSLDLASLQGQLTQVEPALRGDGFGDVITALFDGMRGRLGDEEFARLSELRSPRQDVVLGTWSLLLDHSADEVAAAVSATAGAVRVPYLSLFGIDPGPDYAGWLASLIPAATVEVWDGDGHYPHLVEPDRFLAAVRDFEGEL